MGFTRLYLALCVVAAHSSPLAPWIVHGGTEAVEIFFMISGYYMALISDKYKTSSEFYISRFLKIYVTYWSVCLWVITCSVFSGLLTGKWLVLGSYRSWSTSENSALGVAFTLLANIGLFGSDWIVFIVDDPNQGFHFARSLNEDSNPLARFLLIGPAWSLGVELCFYLFTPLLNRLKTLQLLIVIMVSLVLRVVFYEYFGLTADPWNYRFMPFELALFASGMLSCRFYKKCLRSTRAGEIANRIHCSVPYGVQIVVFLFSYWVTCVLIRELTPFVNINYARLISYTAWCPMLALLFHATRQNTSDRALGELSYPLYLTHYFIVAVISAVYTRLEWLPASWRGMIVAVLAILVSLLCERLITTPFEMRRRNLAARLSGASSVLAAR